MKKVLLTEEEYKKLKDIRESTVKGYRVRLYRKEYRWVNVFDLDLTESEAADKALEQMPEDEDWAIDEVKIV